MCQVESSLQRLVAKHVYNQSCGNVDIVVMQNGGVQRRIRRLV